MSFLHPWFLLLCFAIAIPIAVHLFNFHKFKQVLFTNVQFLQELFTAKKQQNKLYERLLLAARCLSIILLALLFSQPYIKTEEDSLVNKGQNAVVIIVDNSFSMQNSSSKGSLLDVAKLKANEILKQYSDNDVFCLITSDLEGKHKHFVSKQIFLDFLKDVQVSSSSTMYSELVNTTHHLLNLRNEQSKLMFFISDFQSSCFDYQNIKEDSSIKDVYLPLEAKNIANVFIDSLLIDKNIFLKGQKLDLKVRIKNASDEDREKLSVKLFINNKQQSLVTCNIKANTSIEIPLSFVIEDIGAIDGKVHIIDNPITYDDDFYFSLNVSDKIKVLSINQVSSNKYLQKLFDNSSEVQLDNMPLSNLDFSVFAKYNTIILNGLNSISTGLAFEMKKARNNGTSVVIVPNQNIDIQSYNEAMQIMNLPSFISKVDKAVKVTKIDDKNKLFAKVFTHIPKNMQMPEVKTYYKIKNNSNTARQDIMYLANNDAFMTENSFNNSLGFVFASGFDETMSDFVNQTVFVPIMWNIILYSVVLTKPYLFLNSNEIAYISLLKNEINDGIITLQSKDKQFSVTAHLVTKENKIGFNIGNQLNKAGFYNIITDGISIGAIALNYNRNESVLEFLSSKYIDKQLKNNNFQQYSVFNDKKTISTYFTQSKKSFDFTAIILFFLILTFVFEIFLTKKVNEQ